MGGAVSSGDTNDELVDNLKDADYIRTPLVEKVFRSVDRAFYYTKSAAQNPYQDLAWRHGNIHLSAPCIYSEVLESLKLEPGLTFLNIGSGTGYLSTMAGLMLGRGGVNHGIELHQDVVDYARFKLDKFKLWSSAVDIFELCEPQFIVGNCVDALPSTFKYDRIYCGAACPPEFLKVILDSMKIGGILVVPLNDSLVQIKRVSETRVERKVLLSVSFAALVTHSCDPDSRITLPPVNPAKLTELCRSVIREYLRNCCKFEEGDNEEKSSNKSSVKKPKRHGGGTCILANLGPVQVPVHDRFTFAVALRDTIRNRQRRSSGNNSDAASPNGRQDGRHETESLDVRQLVDQVTVPRRRVVRNRGRNSRASSATADEDSESEQSDLEADSSSSPIGDQSPERRPQRPVSSSESSDSPSDESSDSSSDDEENTELAQESHASPKENSREEAHETYNPGETLHARVIGSSSESSFENELQNEREPSQMETSPVSPGLEDEHSCNCRDQIEVRGQKRSQTALSRAETPGKNNGASSGRDSGAGIDDDSADEPEADTLAKKRACMCSNNEEHANADNDSSSEEDFDIRYPKRRLVSANRLDPTDTTGDYMEIPCKAHPLTAQMRLKILNLPVPRAVKMYLNYNRSF